MGKTLAALLTGVALGAGGGSVLAAKGDLVTAYAMRYAELSQQSLTAAGAFLDTFWDGDANTVQVFHCENRGPKWLCDVHGKKTVPPGKVAEAAAKGEPLIVTEVK